MTIVSKAYQMSATNPPNGISAAAPSTFGTYKAVRIANYSPFPAVVTGINDSSDSQTVLPPYTQTLYRYANVRGNINMNFATLSVATVIPTNMLAIVEWSDAPDIDFSGETYPIALSRETTVTVSGPISLVGVTQVSDRAFIKAATFALAGGGTRLPVVTYPGAQYVFKRMYIQNLNAGMAYGDCYEDAPGGGRFLPWVCPGNNSIELRPDLLIASAGGVDVVNDSGVSVNVGGFAILV